MKNMQCLNIQQEVQELLDQRFHGTLPLSLRAHIEGCSECKPWYALLAYTTEAIITPSPLGLPEHFSRQVLQRYHRESNRSRWLRNYSFLACAAAVTIALVTWFVNHPGQQSPLTREPHAQSTITPDQLFTAMQQEISTFRNQNWSLPQPSIEIPTTLTSWEFEELDNPITISYPALRTISQTFQHAVEPFEEPTRNAISRVKAVMDTPEVKKFVNRFI